MRIVSCETSHLTDVKVHQKQSQYQHLIDGATVCGSAWSAFDGDDLIALGGFIEPVDDGEAAWLLFTDKACPHRFFRFVRILQVILRERASDDPPLYVDIDPSYPEARRLALLLGFSPVKTVTFPDGRVMTRMVASV